MYSGERGFVAETVPFILQGLAAGEPVMVAVSQRKIELLRERLGARTDGVEFHDMGELGRNPARIIPAWLRFLDASQGGPARGVGEPVWVGRSKAELAECRIHEHLLNDVLEDAYGFLLVCPYDVASLDPDVAAQARHSHPTICEHGARQESPEYRRIDALAGDRLEPPPQAAVTRRFESDELHHVRAAVAAAARRAGLVEPDVREFVLAVSELAANSIRHGGGSGELRTWHENGSLLCEITDAGQIGDAFVGRRWPRPDQSDGRGLWIVNQVCDLVQIRSDASGTTVRLHKHVAAVTAPPVPA